MKARLLASVCSVLLLTSCSGDDGLLTEGAGEDPRSTEQLSADQAAAEDALLVLGDLPDGWEAQPRDDTDDDSGPDIEQDLADCLGVDLAMFDEDAAVEAKSDTFVLDDAEVESDVSVEATEGKAHEAFAVLAQPKAQGCLRDAMATTMDYALRHPDAGDEMPDGVDIGEVSVRTLSLGDVGDESLGFRIIVPVSANGFEIKVYLDLVAVRVDRATATLTFNNVIEPFDRDLALVLTRTVADRLAAI